MIILEKEGSQDLQVTVCGAGVCRMSVPEESSEHYFMLFLAGDVCFGTLSINTP